MATNQSENSAAAEGLKNWTPSQRAAIEHEGGDLLVSAAAGSGKTAVLAERCARLVCGDGVPRCGIDNLLVLTFTEAAAGEMKTRIAAAIAEKLKMQTGAVGGDERWLRRQAAMVDRAAISTLHAFCARVLRQHFHEAGVDPAFEVMDQDEARLLQDDVLQELFTRWHRLPESGAGAEKQNALTASSFEEFFEAYAQGRESSCGEIILSLHHMLSTIADPQAFITAARDAHGRGAEGAVISYFAQTLGGRLRLIGVEAERACRKLKSYADGMPIIAPLQKAIEAVDTCRGLLAEVRTFDSLGGILNQVVAQLENIWPKQLRTPKEADPDEFKSRKKETYDSVKEEARDLAAFFKADPVALRDDLKRLARPLETLLALAAEFDAAFSAAKRAENQLDFADMERFALTLLTAPNNLAAVELRTRYQQILVDEFQDINPLQAALLNAVRHPGAFEGRGNLFVVGDVKQSIYGFRLADPELFLARERTAMAADAGEKKNSRRRHVALRENFRSQPALIDVMNVLFERLLTPEIAGVDYAKGHELRSPEGGVRQTDLAALHGVPVEVHLLAMEDAEPDATVQLLEENADAEGDEKEDEPASAMELEARFVAQRIAALMGDGRGIRRKDGSVRPLAYRDIAILMRSAKSRAMVFARALSERGIPVHAELTTGFFDTPEVRHAVALLQVLDNSRQEIPLAATLLGPFGGFSHDDLSLIRLTFDSRELSFPEAAEHYARMKNAQAPGTSSGVSPYAPPFSPELAGRLNTFFNKLAMWREKLHGRPLHEGLADIFAESRIFIYVAGLDAGRQRAANLHMLHQRALAFSTFKKQGLHRFLRFIEKLRQQEEADGGEATILSEASNVVRIMTIHKSKGLEFPVVFVSGLGGLLPVSNRGESAVMMDRELGVGLSVIDMERNSHYPSVTMLKIRERRRRAQRAEELRLIYVAITRARDCLILTGQIGKESEVEKIQKQWKGHAGALPEDVLLQGRRAMDWLLAALAIGGGAEGDGKLCVEWVTAVADQRQTDARTAAQVLVTTHPAAAFSPVASQAVESSVDVQRIILAKPLPDLAGDDRHLAPLIARVTGHYPFEEQAHQPAVQTVSLLKTIAGDRVASGEVEAVPVKGLFQADERKTESGRREGAGDAARLRGLATHRVLELLDFTRADTPDEFGAQMASWIAGGQMTREEADIADHEGIRWFLSQSETIERIRTVCSNEGGGGGQLKRELAFAWVGSLSPTPSEMEDLPTIRGVIDLLLVNPAARTAEIIDYKTDSPYLWESRLDEYRLQMNYYMAAASDILGFPVKHAALVFLAARREIFVS